MKVPLSWIREYVTFDQSVDELARLLTTAGLEVASIERTGDSWDRVLVGQVVGVEPHPNADRLVLASVEYGEGCLTVVTGAPNVAAGQKVPLALEGAVLNDAYSETPRKRKLKAGTIRGARSEGMICSERELGISEEHEGIMVLDAGFPVGKPLADVLGDHVLDLDLQPSFAYSSSVIGLAREVAAVTRGVFHAPSVVPLPAGASGAHAQVRGDGLCARYLLQELTDVVVGESSPLIRSRLEASGIRSINNVVDVTNYVMLEYGQPLHAFDAAAVAGHVIVRPASPGEELVTLDHKLRALPEGTIVIADEQKAIGIGGIMGGLNSEVTAETSAVYLESANFNPTLIRRTARALGLRSDASQRFERGLDPELAAAAMARAVELLTAEAGARPVGRPYDWYPVPASVPPLRMEWSYVPRLLGIDVPHGESLGILRSLGFGVTDEGETLVVQPPTFRADVLRPADVVEEIGRVYGYDRIAPTLPAGDLPVQRTDEAALQERRAREFLAAAGLQEVINYDLTSPRALGPIDWFCPSDGGPVLWRSADDMPRVQNPLSADREYLRPSLLPGLLENVQANLKTAESVLLFELDRVFEAAGEGAPNEPKHLGIVLAGLRSPNSAVRAAAEATFFDLKGIVEALLDALHVQDWSFRTVEVAAGCPGLAVDVAGRCTGYLMSLPSVALSRADINRPVYAAELAWEPLVRAASRRVQFQPYSRFPAVRQDLAVLVEDGLASGSVEQVVRRNGGKRLQHVELLEVFTEPPVPAGHKSLLFRLVFQAPDRTLTEEEATRYRRRIEEAVREQLGGRIRGVDW